MGTNDAFKIAAGGATTFNHAITASAAISASGEQITAKNFIAQEDIEGEGGYGFREGREESDRN